MVLRSAGVDPRDVLVGDTQQGQGQLLQGTGCGELVELPERVSPLVRAASGRRTEFVVSLADVEFHRCGISPPSAA